MYRIIFILSVLPLAIALIARWWFGLRVLATEGGRPCRCDLARWLPAPGDDSVIHRAEKSAAEFGAELRLKALADWREQDPKAAAAREGSRRFGIAVPPLSGVVAVMAVLVGKIPVMGAVAILLGAGALAAMLGLLSLPPELRAIARRARGIRQDKSFPAGDDEQAVIQCAIARAWDESLPPILRWLQN
jgi:hypothetical protein